MPRTTNPSRSRKKGNDSSGRRPPYLESPNYIALAQCRIGRDAIWFAQGIVNSTFLGRVSDRHTVYVESRFPSGLTKPKGHLLAIPSIRILVVDPYAPWQSFVSRTLRNVAGMEIIGQIADGLDAVQRANQLQPDLVLLDLRLPTLNGIEAACQIRDVVPTCKILFVSENRSPEIVRGALSAGASGYVVKSKAAYELLPAIRAVLEGKRFVSSAIEDV